jgi:glycosyltransferase involved in cell wall biosynthesis
VLCNGIYPDSVGGAEIHLFNLACRLAERRHNVYVITPVKNILNKTSNTKIPFTKISLKLWPKPFAILSYVVKSIVPSFKLKKQTEIVHAHTADYPTMITAFLFSLFNHKPYIVACRGSDIRMSSRKSLRRALQLPLLRNAKRVAVVSNEIAEILTQKYGMPRHKILVVGNAYDERITQKIANIRLYAETKRSKRIICVANMRPEKDHMTLLKGFAMLVKDMDEVKLLLLGDGPLRGQLEEFCAKHRLRGVRFLGRLPYNDVLENVAKSDIFILTSVEEAMPNVVIEALALGKPVIATRVGGIQEIVKDGFNGLLISPRSPEQLTKALDTLLKDEKLYTRLSSNTTKSVLGHSWSEITSRYEQMYANLLNLS